MRGMEAPHEFLEITCAKPRAIHLHLEVLPAIACIEDAALDAGVPQARLPVEPGIALPAKAVEHVEDAQPACGVGIAEAASDIVGTQVGVQHAARAERSRLDGDEDARDAAFNGHLGGVQRPGAAESGRGRSRVME